MSPRKRPSWVRKDGEWVFQTYRSSMFPFEFSHRYKFRFERAKRLQNITKSGLKVPSWWDGGIQIKGGPVVIFRIEVKYQAPEFTSVQILGNPIYPTINKVDLEEITLNLNRILLWSVREIATETSELFVESKSLPSNKITEADWLSLGQEISRLADRRKTTTEHLKNVAMVYSGAKRNKYPTTRAIQEELNYSASRARALVSLARKEGFLPPTKRNQKKDIKN